VPTFPDGKPMVDAQGRPASPKSRLAAALLAFFLGALGVHRFYVGKIGTGIAIILTFGGFFGIWPLIDLIMILVGSFKDKEDTSLRSQLVVEPSGAVTLREWPIWSSPTK
jgi:TM2 domain-containing membrane protein YozV